MQPTSLVPLGRAGQGRAGIDAAAAVAGSTGASSADSQQNTPNTNNKRYRNPHPDFRLLPGEVLGGSVSINTTTCVTQMRKQGAGRRCELIFNQSCRDSENRQRCSPRGRQQALQRLTSAARTKRAARTPTISPIWPACREPLHRCLPDGEVIAVENTLQIRHRSVSKVPTAILAMNQYSARRRYRQDRRRRDGLPGNSISGDPAGEQPPRRRW